MEFFTLIAFGFLTGILSSMFGFGGGFIIVPLLYRILPHNSYSMQIAIATSLGVMITNSAFSVYNAQKNNSIIWKLIFPIFYYIGCGSVIGAFVTTLLPSSVVRYIFIAYMLFVIMNCVRKKSFVKKEDKVISLSKNRHVVFGLLIGSTASLLGVGGSIITIPLMRKLGLSMKHAAAIGNMLSLPVALVGAIVYAFLGNKLNLELGNAYLGLVYLPALFVLSMTGFIGVPIGSYLVNKISDKTHAIGFILLLFISLTAILV